MDKARLADVDACVGGTSTDSEDHQVPRAGMGGRHRLAPGADHPYGSWGCDVGSTLIDVADQSTAIEATVWRVAAIAVERAHESHGLQGCLQGLLVGHGRSPQWLDRHRVRPRVADSRRAADQTG